jgi:hypothetical protein
MPSICNFHGYGALLRQFNDFGKSFNVLRKLAGHRYLVWIYIKYVAGT